MSAIPQKILAANWKLHKTCSELPAYFTKFRNSHIPSSQVRCIVCPSPTLLQVCAQEASPLMDCFSQNVSWAESGAFTGEISPAQLLELKVKGTLIGHSERRQYFNESDESALKRAENALKAGLQVIYCVGETLAERQAGQTQAVLEKQLRVLSHTLLPGLKDSQNFILAYEPVWAIGTGLVANNSQIEEAHALIAAQLAQSTALPLSILYGGSVKPENFKEISRLKNVSGALVGGASLEADSFLALYRILSAE